jgi:hypothetical protein
MSRAPEWPFGAGRGHVCSFLSCPSACLVMNIGKRAQARSSKKVQHLFDKYLYPSRYHSSTSGSFMGRASYAASRIFVTRDESGKRRVNTSYFLGVLTSVAADAAAYRPYWARSASTTFSNFGSTIGSDAGINLFHEFGPGIRQIVKGHTPRFVSQIEQRITHDQTPLHSVSTPAR